MTGYSASGLLVPNGPESTIAPEPDASAGRVAAFPTARQRPPPGDGLVYRDPAMLAVVQRAQRIARSDASVLISGESGTGKEVIARYIHRLSPRCNGPFVAVNCAAIPEQLLESELFGYERGAFSGALGQRIGKLEAAQNGTILLDEISEMDLRLQAKLLRALQEREIDRVGGRAPIRLNVRIIATTNTDLEREVARQTFRVDLYFRLNVVAIHLPRLRDRPKDIQVLAEHFVEKYRWDSGRASGQLSAAAIGALIGHDWPGNVRELENTIHRALVLTADPVIGVKALEIGSSSGTLPALQAIDPTSDFVGRPLHLIERDVIINTLQHTGGNRTRAAVMLGLSIRALRNKIGLYAAQGVVVPPCMASGAAGTPRSPAVPGGVLAVVVPTSAPAAATPAGAVVASAATTADAVLTPVATPAGTVRRSASLTAPDTSAIAPPAGAGSSAAAVPEIATAIPMDRRITDARMP
ncbi:MAG TPA: sigma-54 dependent transcriptional regulator [Rhodopila sp.]